MFRLAVLMLALCLSPLAATAQQEPIFDDYETMRAELDELIKSREFKAMMLRFGGSATLSLDDLDDLEMRMRDAFPYDFRHVSVIDSKIMENGFRHEMYAYWTGLRYLYVLIFLHQREDELVSINIRFNTDFYALMKDF